MKLEEIHRIRLCNLPTPLVEAPGLSAELGGPQILIKRDDLTGLAMGGNKSRAIEFLMSEIKDRGTDILVAVGYQQSNMVCQLTAAARKLGMDVILFVSKGEDKFQGNLLLNKLLGAEIRFTGMELHDLPIVYEQMDNLAAELRRQGRTPYVRYYEGFGPLELASYVFLVQEICEQLQEKQLTAQYLFLASGAGNQAGLIVGAKYFRAPFKVVGVMPNRRHPGAKRVQMIADQANKTAKFLEMNFTFKPEEINYFDGYTGEGYQGPTKKGIEAIKLVAQTEGIFLDPLYTGKAMACLVDQIRDGKIKREDTVIFYHSGGLPAIFSHSEELSA